jgi:DNA-binding transcriptional regulator LsrR (DeoR family)
MPLKGKKSQTSADAEKRLVAIAEARFAPLRAGRNETPIAELAERFGVSRNSIQPAIREAFRRGLLEVRVSQNDRRMLVEPEYRIQRLEDKLVEAYGIPSAVVVRTRETDSDLVHRDLGYAMARTFPTLVQNGNVIGLGSGRGPYYTVTGLIARPSMPAREITLMSLTGAVYPKTHRETLNVILDADYHTCLMGLCFSHPLKGHSVVSYPIASRRDRANTWLADDKFKDHVPSLAIVGLGVLRGQHRFAAMLNKEPEPSLQPILRELTALVELSARYTDKEYCCVADVCHHLFFVDAPDDRVPREARDKMERLIREINDKSLTVNATQLASIRGLCVVAGTPEKRWAIRRLLDRCSKGHWNIQVLCVDERTAEVL